MLNVIALLVLFNNVYYMNTAVLPPNDNTRYPLSYLCTGTENMTKLYGNCFPHTLRSLRYPVYEYDVHVSDNLTLTIEAIPIISDNRTIRLPRFLCQPQQTTTEHRSMIMLKCNSTENNRILNLHCINNYEFIMCDISL